MPATSDGELIKLRGDHLSWRRIENEIVVLDGMESVYFVVNRVGAELWELLGRGATRGTLVAALADNHDLSTERARTDVDAFLVLLRDQHLLEE